jgi:CHAT domain-containing protein/tetratricopeptide (TPR) repeat protein
MNSLKKNIIIFVLSILFNHIIFGINKSFSTIDKQKMVDSSAYLIDLADKFRNIGDFEKFALYVNQSYQIKKQIYGSDDPIIANSLINIAIDYFTFWEIDSALITLNQAEKIYLTNRNTNKGYLGYIYTIMGNIYFNKGDFEQAARYYSYAEQLLKNFTEEPFVGMKIALYIWSVELERTMGFPAISLKYYQKCLNEIKKNGASTSLLINCYLESSLTYSKLGQNNNSIELLIKAIDLCKRDSANNVLQMAILYNNIANNFLSLNNYKESEKYFDNAITISHHAGLKGIYLSNLQHDMGKMEVQRQENINALKYFQAALKALVPRFVSDNPVDNPEIKWISAQLPALNILKSKTNCLYKLYLERKKFEYLDAAINTSLLSIELIEELRNSYLSYESKVTLEGQEDATYKTTLALCNEAYNSTKNTKYSEMAFTVSEKNKSSVLLSGLRELKAKNFGEIPDSLLNKEKQLMKEISFYKEKIYEENKELSPDSSKIKTWNNYLFSNQRAYDQLVKLFEKNYPGYYALKYDNTVSKPGELQKALPRNTTLVEYALSDSALYTFVIANGEYHFVSQKVDSNFYMQVENYLKEYHQFDFSKQYYSRFTEFCWNNKEIYDVLIKPVAPYINNENLVIVPDGILSFLPFETLIDQLPKSFTKGYYKDLNYLLFKYNISYAYSSTFYCQINEHKENRNTKKLLAFAPEYAPNAFIDLQKRNLVTRQKYRKDLYPIPGVMDEVAAIKSLIPTDVYSGSSATESNFKKIAGNYDILHLAMHTVIDNKDPMYSKLIFTQDDDTINDGLLNTYEIFGLKLKAKMVVLSACSTGEGGYSKGEGVISLARGFVYAGCPSLLMTLWEVEDKSSVSLMRYFYGNLLKGQSKTKALREAKIKFLKEAKAENSHPFFWSSFVLMGNSEPIFYSVWAIILPFGLSVVFIAGIIIWIKRRKAGS